MPKELKEKPERTAKQNILTRILVFLTTFALVLGAVALVLARDKLNMDAMRRYLTYRSLIAQGENGAGLPFPYDGGLTGPAADLDGDLLCVSASGVRLYDPGGAAFVDETAELTHPVGDVVGDAAVVYDAGGSFLKVYRGRTEVFSLAEPDGAILSARLSDAGWLAVVTRGAGYKGVVTVYNAKFAPVMAVRLSSVFVMDAVLSPDSKTLAVVTAGQNNHTFESKLVTYAVVSSAAGTEQSGLTPLAELSLGNSVPLDLCWRGGAIRALTEHGLTVASPALERLGGLDWTGEYLKEFSQIPADFSALLISRHRAGNTARLVTVGTNGEILGEYEIHEQVLSLAAGGRYCAVLTGGRLSLFTSRLEPYAASEITGDPRRAVLRADGSAMLLNSESAWLFVPE